MENPPQSENTRSIFRNVLYGFSTWILPLGLSFIATPLLVRNLGNDDYGIYALVMGVVGYTFNLSFGRAVTKYIAEYRATGEAEKIRDVVSASLFINTAIGLLGLTAISLSAKWLVADVFQIGAEDYQKSVTALYVSALIIFSLIINQVFNAVLQGVHRFDVYSKIINFNSLGVLAGNIALAYGGYGIVSLFVWNLTINGISAVLYIYSAKRVLPEFGISFKFNPRYLKLILRYSAGIICYQIFANILLLFERIWITRQLGSENLTFYVIPMSLGIYIHGFISSLIMVIFPLASGLKDKPERLLRLYLKANKVVSFFVVFLGTTLIVESRVFLTLWLGTDFAEKSASLLIVHALTFSLLATLMVSWQMTEGLGYTFQNAIAYMLCLLVTVCVMIGLTQSLGSVGIALGKLAGYGVLAVYLVFVEKWFFKRIQAKFWAASFGKLFVAAALSIVFQKIIIENFQISWIAFLGATLGGGLIYCLALLLLKFVSEEEKLLVKNLIFR